MRIFKLSFVILGHLEKSNKDIKHELLPFEFQTDVFQQSLFSELSCYQINSFIIDFLQSKEEVNFKVFDWQKKNLKRFFPHKFKNPRLIKKIFSSYPYRSRCKVFNDFTCFKPSANIFNPWLVTPEALIKIRQSFIFSVSYCLSQKLILSNDCNSLIPWLNTKISSSVNFWHLSQN